MVGPWVLGDDSGLLAVGEPSCKQGYGAHEHGFGASTCLTTKSIEFCQPGLSIYKAR